MVQLENELDFFDCEDRPGYLTALRDQASSHGIDVPLIACAGQGDLVGATGDVDGVVPACNFYPDDDSPFIEEEVRRYARAARRSAACRCWSPRPTGGTGRCGGCWRVARR